MQYSWGSGGVRTRSIQPGHFVSDNPTMKAWLAKIPGAFRGIKTQSADVKITNIDLKWKQTKTVRTVAHTNSRLRRKTTQLKTYVCELRLTIEYQDSSAGENAPDQIAMARPITVNSRCDTFLANNNMLIPPETGASS